MNNDKPLTPQQLALCLGCEAEVQDYWDVYRVEITTHLLNTTSKYKSIKPILRRLESITEEQWAELNQVDNTGLPQFYSTFIKNYSPEYVWTFTPKQFQWLLSKWFDLKLFPLGSYIIQN